MRTRRSDPRLGGGSAKSPGDTHQFARRCIAPRRSPVRVRLAPSPKGPTKLEFFDPRTPLRRCRLSRLMVADLCSDHPDARRSDSRAKVRWNLTVVDQYGVSPRKAEINCSR